MPPQENEDRVEDMEKCSLTESQQIDDLLALNREAVRRAATDRIAAGMYQRVTQAVLADGAERQQGRRWGLVYAGTSSLLVVALWIGLAHRSSRSGPDLAARTVAKTGVGAPLAPSAGASMKPEVQAVPRRGAMRLPHSRPNIARARVTAKPVPGAVPELVVFPAVVAPTEQERLLMQIARSHPEQLVEIAQQVADEAQEVQERRRAFEKWIKDGGGSL
jgi:hypothetical protein